MEKKHITKLDTIFYIVTTAVIIISDQGTKWLVAKQFHISYPIIDGLLEFIYVENKGAAWGILQGRTWLFLLVALASAIGMIYYFRKLKQESILTRYGLVLTFAGMVGNVIDRLFLGYVRDFISVIIFGYHFPIFNIADMAVVIGVIFIIWEMALGEYYGKQ